MPKNDNNAILKTAMARTSTKARRTSAYNLSGAFELFGKSYEIIKRNFEVFMVLFSVGALLALWDSLGRYVDEKEQGRDWGNLFQNSVFGPDVNSGVLAAGGFMFLVTVVYLILYMLLIIAVVRSAQGHRLKFSSLWQEFTGNWLWLKLIGAFIALGISLVIGFVLLIIPGVILLWRLFMVPYVLVDQKVSIGDAFKRSWDMTRGYAWPIYSIILVAILLSLPNIIPLIGGIIAFILSAVYSVAPALRYEELKKLNS